MTTREVEKSSLTRKIREMAHTNQARGDRERNRGKGWGIYGEKISNYDWSLSAVLLESISNLLKHNASPVVLDIMAPSEAVATLFEQIPDKSKLGITVSLEDLRSDAQKKRDEILSIKQIAGDIMQSSTWDEIEENLHGRKADLIMERALDGLYCLPPDPRLFAMLLNKAWRLLSENNGVLVAEVPSHLEFKAQEWIFDLRVKTV